VPDFFISWDRATFLAINNGLQNRLFDAIMPPISDLGLGHVQVLAVLLAAVIAGARKGEIKSTAGIWRALSRRRGWIYPLLAAWALSGITSTTVKNSVVRDRPTWFYKHEHEAGRSMDVQVHTIPGRRPVRVRGVPSGHTATSVALATAFTLIGLRRRWSRKWAAASWCIALLVSFSRIYVADHWPLDVVAGAVIGLLGGWAGVALCERYSRRSGRGAGTVEPDSDGALMRVAWSG
jgi:membrane-associated phospholipid phosphatase